jgi:hypothetical protein
MNICQLPHDVLSSLVSSSVEDRMLKKQVRARRVFSDGKNSFICIGNEFHGSRMLVSIVKVSSTLFHHDFIWNRNNQRWAFESTGQILTTVLECDISPAAVALAISRQSPKGYGMMLELDSSLLVNGRAYLMSKGFDRDKADYHALIAFQKAMDAITYIEGTNFFACLNSAYYSRLSNEFRYEQKAGRASPELSLIEDLTSEEMDVPLVCGSLAHKIADLVLGGQTFEEASESLCLTEAERQSVKQELALALGV